MEFIFDDNIKLKDFMTLKNSKKIRMIKFQQNNRQQKMIEKKLQKYHENIGNNSLGLCKDYFKSILKIEKDDDHKLGN